MSPLNPHSYSEKQLVNGSIKGDTNCQKELFHRFAGKMFTICRRYIRIEVEAEDVLQDGFVKVFKYLYQFKFHGSLESWIRTIMIHTALKHLRKKANKMESLTHEHIAFESGSEDILSRLSEEEILNHIKQLPDGYRAVFNMYAIEGYSHKEISQMLGIRESTSRSQLVKARKFLQKQILQSHKIAI